MDKSEYLNRTSELSMCSKMNMKRLEWLMDVSNMFLFVKGWLYAHHIGVQKNSGNEKPNTDPSGSAKLSLN